MPPRSRSPSRTRSPPSRSGSPRRRRRSRSPRYNRSSRRDDRDYHRRDRDRDRERRSDYYRDRDRRESRRSRRRSRTRTRSRSPPSPPQGYSAFSSAAYNDESTPPQAELPAAVPVAAIVKEATSPNGGACSSFILPSEIKAVFLKGVNGIFGSEDEQNAELMTWIGEKVVELVEERMGKMDDVVRERVVKEKIEIEARLRVQIEQEMREEMIAAQKRQEESQQRCQSLEDQLSQKIKDVENAQRLAQEERLEMLASRSRLDMERAEMEKERKKLVASEQQTILNTGGIRAPIKLKFGK